MYINRAKEFINVNLIRRCHIYHNHRLTDFPLTYQAKDVRSGWYKTWEENKYFQPKNSNAQSYTMILPPPNITGILHLGHALTVTIQDILARWYRMKGVPVLWIPGLDHAGIATQTVVEKYLYNTRGIKRNDMTKDEFLNVVGEWKNEKSLIIEDQLKTLGASLDWSRSYFTMSQQHHQAVIHAILILHKRNLLYRDKRLINWSPSLCSTLSDIEVEYETLSGKTDLEVPGYDRKVTFGQLFEISYDVKDSHEKLHVATTRPETLLGDVALAVHPDDERYSQYIGRMVKHPLKETYIPVVTDSNVKRDFSTGIVKITPAHNQFDYTVAKNHNLDIIDIIDEDGKLNDKAGQYKGLLRFVARQKIVKDLANRGNLISIKDHEMEIPRCSRTGDIIELLMKEQWFIKCENMIEKALEAVKNGSLKLDPSFHNQTWIHWLLDSQTKDWCISRQIWYGHQIPAYQCEIDKTWIIAASKNEAEKIVKEKYGYEAKVKQDEDVLDTWFSSAILPFTSLGWPINALDFQKHYPLSLMETGKDILFFWVARMVMLGLELTNQLPFKEVLLHGVLCDAQGKKMSKSRGNVILPENVINGISLEKLNEQTKNSFEMGILTEKEMKKTLTMNTKMLPNGIVECGVDALRLSLCSHNIKENTISFNITECEQNKFFCNKIWQSSRYLLLVTNDKTIQIPKSFTTLDQWILSRLSWLVQTVNYEIEQKKFSKVILAIKEFLYYEFCDYFVEGTKHGFKSENADVIISHRYTLAKCLEVSLRILAPITPHLCDDLYSKLSKKLSLFEFKNSLLESSYPTNEEFQNLRNIELEHTMTNVIKVISSLRALVGNVNNKSDVEGHIVVNNSKDQHMYIDNINVIKAVSKLQNIKIISNENYIITEKSIQDNTNTNCSVYLAINNDVIFEQVKQRIEKRKITARKKLEKLLKLVNNASYESDVSKTKKLKDQEAISSLQEELKRIPMTIQ